MTQENERSISNEFMTVITKVSGIVHKISGNILGENQFFMIESRLKKRMMELGIKEASAYIKYIDQNLESESGILVGLITTHHTFFFREFIHFEILKKMLPNLVASVKKRGEKNINIWSAACSHGQEAYSLGMFMDYYLKEIDPSISFKILGTDIDSQSVSIAKNGVYHQNEIKEIPMNFLGNHWAKGTGDIAMYSKIKNKIKEKCEFRKGNLLNLFDAVKSEKFDIIFCRNVFIYFELQQVEQISKELLAHLHTDGVLFSGVSEPLSNLTLKINSIGPSAYMAKTDNLTNSAITSQVATSIALAENTAPAILRVMCVDDSPSILTLLKKILSKEHGFEIVATACNGLDAIEKLKTHKVDLVTLDIHMPEMDGLSYLQGNFNKSHPPVIIISSTSRSDSDVAMKALKFGASDFIEKPAFNNIEESGDEIRTKIRSLVQDTLRKPVISTFDNENQKQFIIQNPEQKMRVIVASISDFSKLRELFNNLDKSQPISIIFFEGNAEILNAVTKEHSKDFKQDVLYYENPEMKLESNKIYFADFKSQFEIFYKKYNSSPCSVLIFGNISTHAAKSISSWRNIQLLLEDLGEQANKSHPLKSYSTDVVPVTSFSYMSCRYLSSK